MALPLILVGAAVVTAAVGLKTGIDGGNKMKNAKTLMERAKVKQDSAIRVFNKKNNQVIQLMDEIGRRELYILSTFDDFSDAIEKIQGRPHFEEYRKDGVDLPKYEAEELKKLSAGADILLGGVSAAAVGTAGGFAAAGATSAAVMALGTASTGTAISSLTGVAATNATLAALGGGSIAAGGLGMTVGTALLGTASLGVGLMIGGIIFNIAGSKLSDKADEAFHQACRTERDVYKILGYFNELSAAATKFYTTFRNVEDVYLEHLKKIQQIINVENRVQWAEYSDEEKKLIENTILLVGVMYMMCKVKLVIKQDKEDLNKVNREEVENVTNDAETVLREVRQ